MVLPWSRRRRIRSFISRDPIGSRPVVGSSSTNKSGSLIKAWASPMRRVHAFGVLFQLATPGSLQPDHLDQLFATLSPDVGWHIEQTTIEIERLLGIQKLIQIRFLGEISDPLVLRDFGCFFSENKGSSGCRKKEVQGSA